MNISKIKNEIINSLIFKKDDIVEDIQNYVVESIDTIHTEAKYNKLSESDINYINERRITIGKIYDFIDYIDKFDKESEDDK